MKILVTDGESRPTLSITRALGREGHIVLVCAGDGCALATCSSFCHRAFRVPDPMTNAADFAQAVGDIVRRETVEMVVPVTEQSIYALNMLRPEIEKTTAIACAPPEKMVAVSDKFQLFQMASRLRVPMPKTIFVKTPVDYLNHQEQVESFPVVVKPSFSKILEKGSIAATHVMYARDHGELQRLYEVNPMLRRPSLIQECIIGEGTGLFTLFDHDRHLALFSHRRLLEKPPTGGTSVLSESVPLDQNMVEAARKLLTEVKWTGIAMVEFKRDANDGVAKLMEINGRFWGSLQLAVGAGINFPALCLDYHRGIKPSTLVCDYEIGQRLKWPFGILDHLFIRLKSKRDFPPLRQGLPSPLKVLQELLKPQGNGTFWDVYDPDDAAPFHAEAYNYLRQLLRLLHP